MAAEGCGNTILTRALQLVPGPSKLLGDLKPTLTSFLLRNGHRNVFSPPLAFLSSRFDAPSVHLLYSCLKRSLVGIGGSGLFFFVHYPLVRIARASEAYETRLRSFRFRPSVIHYKKESLSRRKSPLGKA